MYFKPYTACRHTHGAAQAILSLLEETPISPAQVDRIDVHTYGIAELAVGKGVDAGSTFVSAQFSIPYVVAACLLDRTLGPRQLTEKRMADEAIIALTQKVRVHTDVELNRRYPDVTASRVTVLLNDGRHFERQIDIPKGDPRDPMTDADIADKVRSFAGNREPARIEEVIGLILNLESVTDMGEIAKRI